MEMKELNLEEKVVVRNIAGWTTGFRRIETVGDVTIPAEGTVRLSRSEIISQVQSGNRLFLGVDERGSHATLYIDDKETRVELDFESSDSSETQMVLTSDAAKKMFDCKSIKTFESKLHEMVVTRAEKYALIQIIKKEKINDYEKIRIVENYTGYQVKM